MGKIWRRAWQPTPVFCLEKPKDRGARGATVHRVEKSQDMTKTTELKHSTDYSEQVLVNKRAIYCLIFLIYTICRHS